MIFRLILLRIRNVLGKSRIESQNTHFMISGLFPRIVSFIRKCRKICLSQKGLRWQYGGASHAWLVRLHERKHTSEPVNTHPLTRKQVRTHIHTEIYLFITEISETSCFPLQQWFRKGSSVLRHTHNACIVFYHKKMTNNEKMENYGGLKESKERNT
jgi:hypothetical protein